MYYKINNKLTLKTRNGRIERKIRIFSWINLTFSYWGEGLLALWVLGRLKYTLS